MRTHQQLGIVVRDANFLINKLHIANHKRAFHAGTRSVNFCVGKCAATRFSLIRSAHLVEHCLREHTRDIGTGVEIARNGGLADTDGHAKGFLIGQHARLVWLQGQAPAERKPFVGVIDDQKVRAVGGTRSSYIAQMAIG